VNQLPEQSGVLGPESILVIEDDLAFARLLVTFLKKQGYDAETVPTAAEMFQKLEDKTYDCLIVDLTLPDEDGIVLVRKLRARAIGPLIVLTGRDGIDDKLASFEVGADDYVTKPVDPREIVMRIKAVRSRSTTYGADAADKIKLGTYLLDHEKREVSREDGTLVDVTPAEFNLMWVLAQAEGKVLSRDILVDAVSTGDGPASFRAVDILVSRVRKKLDKEAILTVPNSGYKCGWPVSQA
jgi:DNA-binding response OmpR family regulator